MAGVTVECPCGTRFHARSSRARYCSAKCRQRALRAAKQAANPMPKVAKPAKRAPKPRAKVVRAVAKVSPTVETVGPVAEAVLAELLESDAVDSAAGRAALKLALLVDDATMFGGASVAGWVREMRAALAEARAVAPPQEADPIDELERRRATRGA